jgi:hypothetical protein
MRGRAVIHPGRLFVAFAGRADDGRIDKRALAHNGALGFKIARDRCKETPVEPVCDKLAAEAHEGGVRSGVASSREKPQKRRKLARSESASESVTSERSCHVASKSALNIAKGGQAFSPFAEG